MQRSYPSGAQKRAAALEKKEAQVAEKIPKLTTFFTAAGGTREETEQRPDSNAEAQAIVFAPEHAVTAEVNSLSRKSDSAMTISDSFSNDPNLWPESISENFRNYWIQRGAASCQHINESFGSISSTPTEFVQGGSKQIWISLERPDAQSRGDKSGGNRTDEDVC